MSQFSFVFRRLFHRSTVDGSISRLIRQRSLSNPNRALSISYFSTATSSSSSKSSPNLDEKPRTIAASNDDVTNDDDELIISDRAAERLKKIAADGEYLRVLVDSGGCSGFEYKFQLVSKPDVDDRVFEKDGARLLVDELSLDLLRGSTVDYQMELIKAAFQIVRNPRAEKGCSCGSSFALKNTPAVSTTTKSSSDGSKTKETEMKKSKT